MSKKLDRKDVKNAAWTWMFFHHCAQNFERMQGLAFCHTMSKPLEKLYGDNPEELKAALTRHMQFFNTEPQLGSVIPGITIALEEARANGGEVNAVSLSMGWSPGCSVLFRWIPQKRWGLFMGLFDAFAFLGGIIIYPVAGFAITFLSWRAAFFLPALLLLMWSVVFCIYVKDTPQQYGFTVEWEHAAKSAPEGSGDAEVTELTKIKGLPETAGASKPTEPDTVCLRDYADVMKHPAILLTALATICSQFVRWGLVNWIVKILITPRAVVDGGLSESADGIFAGGEHGGFGIALMAATVAASAMHWGGAFFSITLGHISDTVFHGKRWQTIFIGFLVSTVGLLVIYFFGIRILMLPGGVVLLGALLFFSGGCIQGVQAPLFNLPGDILGTRLGGTGVGIVNGWSYLGASFAGITLGAMMDAFGLTSCLLLMAGISLLGAIVILVLRK